MKRILVTGGAGFVGSALVSALIMRGNEATVLDSFLTGKETNLKHLISSSSLKIIKQDVQDPIIGLKPEEIYNLACPASPVHYQKDPVNTTVTNVLGAINALDLARTCDARILQASTSEVYGDPEIHPQTEEYWGSVNPIGIRSCYDEGKRCAETLFFDYHRQYKTRIKVARIFNTYGPNMDSQDGRVVSNFIVQALKGEDITIYGDGSQTRSFCYVDDLVSGLIKLMESKESLTGPINLGNPNEFSMLELAEKIITKTKTSSKIIFMPLPQDDPKQRQPDITKAKTELSWSPITELDEGLDKTISYFRDSLGFSN
jgi:UDP-glucuronate decarboxylase